MNFEIAKSLRALLTLRGYEADITLVNSSPSRYIIKYWDGEDTKVLTQYTTLEELTFLTTGYAMNQLSFSDWKLEVSKMISKQYGFGIDDMVDYDWFNLWNDDIVPEDAFETWLEDPDYGPQSIF